MNAFSGVAAVVATSAVGMSAVILAGEGSTWPVWVVVASATVLPGLAAYHGAKKARRLRGREGLSWASMAVAMTLMTPIYFTEFIGAFDLEYLLISAAYFFGAVAIIMAPMPAAGPFQRIVASLDSLSIGIVVATATFWIAAGSNLDTAGYTLWAVSDASIMAMIGYVALRRSFIRGIDWALVWLALGVLGYLAGVLISTVSEGDYYVGHVADLAYMVGMTSFALAPAVRDRRAELGGQIMKPVRWLHVTIPYFFVGILAIILFAYQIVHWNDDPTRAVVVLGLFAAMVLALLRQLAMIAEQRRKIEIEQRGVIATVSHELRTPLTSVVGFLELLEDWDSFSDEEKIEMVALMRNQSQVLARVVGDLVAVARSEIEHLDVSSKWIPVEDLLSAARDVVPELETAQVVVDMAPGTLVFADRSRILQVVTNFLSNAAKYGRGRVDIAVHTTDTDTVIEVHDNGPGVPDIFRLVIWERFERGPQRQGAIPGSGIGLSVARGIARSHNGDTNYRRSERLGGACFAVRLPIPLQVSDGVVVAWQDAAG